MDIESGGTVTATGGGGGMITSYGMFAHAPLTVSGTLTATGGNDIPNCQDGSYGLYAYDVVTIKNSGSATLTGGGNVAARNYGLFAKYSLYIPISVIVEESGELIARCEDNNNSGAKGSYGVYTSGSMDIAGTLTATGGSASSDSYGIYSGTCDISGTVTATGGEVTGYYTSYGVYNDGNLFIYNGSATVSGGRALYKMDSSIVADEAVNVSVSANENGTGAAAWDKTTGLTEYKYIKTEGGAEIYGVFVGEKAVNSANRQDVFGDGKVSYDNETKTLTLNGYTYEGAGYIGKSAGIYSDHDLTLLLNGENSITHTDDTANENNGIKTEGALTIDGAGSVTAYGASGKQYARGMYVNGVLIVNGGAVTATGGSDTANGSKGISYNRAFLNGGSVTARGGNTKGNYSYGMDGAYLTVNDDAVLNASSGKGVYRYGNYGESYGIYSTQMTTMNGGAVTATGGESENYSAGIRGNLTVNDGQVIATGGYGKLRSCGA